MSDTLKPDDEEQHVEQLVVEVMKIERRFGYELRNVQSDRRDGIREAIERLSKANGTK